MHGSYSIARMDGRKFDWIRKQLGLSKAELARQHGISRQSLYQCILERSAATCCSGNSLVTDTRIARGTVRRTERTGRRGCREYQKGRQRIRCAKKKELKFFVENVTIRYIFAIQDYLRSNKTMFMSSEVRLLSPEKLANSAVLAAGLSQASGSACGFIQSTGAAFGGLIGAAVTALSERHLAGVRTSLVIAAIGGLAWLLPLRSSLQGELLPT